MLKDPKILQIKLMFKGLNGVVTERSYPAPGALADELNDLIDDTQGDNYTISVKSIVASRFATAAVEMWHRAVHSFLIGASLTQSSPLWSSVAGYYSSHYTIRGLAHLLGYFQLYKRRRVIELNLSDGHYYCKISKKMGGDREHKVCWKIVKGYKLFTEDPFFTINDDNSKRSDAAHRNKANYQDHVGRFPKFQPLDDAYLEKRISLISQMELSDAPIPNADSFPDLVNVQLIAYHRMVRFRMLVDEILGGSNRFWTANRNPEWCPNYLKFQLMQPQYSQIYQGIS